MAILRKRFNPTSADIPVAWSKDKGTINLKILLQLKRVVDGLLVLQRRFLKLVC